MSNKKRLLSYFKKEKIAIIYIFVFLFVFLISQAMIPFLVGRLIDSMVEVNRSNDVVTIDININSSLLITYTTISIILIILGAICDFFFEIRVARFTQTIIAHFRKDVYHKINNTPVSRIEEKPIGTYVHYIVGDMENITLGISSVFKQLIQGILQVLITIILMFVTNWFLAICVIVLSPLSLLVSKFVASFSHKHFNAHRELTFELTQMSIEKINNINLVQSLNYQEESQDEYNKKNEDIASIATISQFAASWTNPATRLVNNFIYAIIGIIGIVMAYNSFFNMGIGDISAFLTYTSGYTKPFNEISSVIGEYESCKVSLNKVNQFLNTNDDIDGDIVLDSEIENIELKDLTFAYENGKKAISNISLKINKGEKIAIVGQTGSGKTTLISLLLRFYEPTSGKIIINGKDITSLNKKSLREHIGMVLQDTWLFNGTVYENLKFGNNQISDEKVKKLCINIGADNFISKLKDNYNTVISSSTSLSDGQKQILTIIRALLSKNDLVILDEATSNIDTRNELILNDALNKLTKNKTSIIIAHRLSTIINADRILALRDGKLIEEGSHNELIKKKGYYYNLYQSQFK